VKLFLGLPERCRGRLGTALNSGSSLTYCGMKIVPHKLQKVERLLLSAEGGGRLPDLPGNWSKGRRWCLGALQSAARVRLCASGILSAFRLQRAVIRWALGWGAPVRLACGLTKALSLEGTHTIVLDSKKFQHPRSS